MIKSILDQIKYVLVYYMIFWTNFHAEKCVGMLKFIEFTYKV